MDIRTIVTFFVEIDRELTRINRRVRAVSFRIHNSARADVGFDRLVGINHTDRRAHPTAAFAAYRNTGGASNDVSAGLVFSAHNHIAARVYRRQAADMCHSI